MGIPIADRRFERRNASGAALPWAFSRIDRIVGSGRFHADDDISSTKSTFAYLFTRQR
jgi:hypothetical protein